MSGARAQDGEFHEVDPIDLMELERRMATVLPDGWKLSQVHAEQPATTYSEFNKEILNEISRCLLTPYNVAACNSPAYNYASGRLDPAQASPAELRGEALFFGKAQCAVCHPAPYYTDNLMHNLHTERFFKPQTIHGHTTVGDGPIKTFPLRGIKDSPPYLHDGRLLTLEDTVEFFNLILGTQLSAEEKADLVAFLRCL